MTDNEIIKALKMEMNIANLVGRPRINIAFDLLKEVSDLINCQKIEIEKLKDELQRAKVEISKHFDYLDAAANEAIKEFAERLKEKQIIDNLSLDGKYYVYVEDIDELVKEMTEQNNG